MTLLVRLSASLLLLCALLKISQANCVGKTCADNQTTPLTVDTTTVTFEANPNCNLSTGDERSGQGSIHDLTPGVVHSIFFSCLNCCKEVTTKPETVTDLKVTGITSSSMSLKWTKPNGNSPTYRVNWTDGKDNNTVYVTETSMIITNLTPGVQYNVSVTAVADDNVTVGGSATVSRYTKPEVVRGLTVMSVTTSSMFVNWTEPEGESSVYRVQWKPMNGKMNWSSDVTETHINITNLTAGVQYEISVSAVVEDGSAEGEKDTVTGYTKPDKIGSLIVSSTSSSIYLNWTAPPGEVFRYKIEWHNGGAVMVDYTQVTSTVISDLSPGTSYTIHISAENGAKETGEPYTFTSDTKPAVVKDLTIKGVTSSSVSLSWARPEGNATSYTVQWIQEGISHEKTTNETSFNITELGPGYQYKITVSAVSGDPANKGQGNMITTFTRPVAPAHIEVKLRGTDFLNIDWTLPEGRVDHFAVSISNKELKFSDHGTTTGTNFNFTGLKPGRVFAIAVAAVAGNFSETSEAPFATYPAFSGPIVISSRTNSLLHIQWTVPAEMADAPNISYLITYSLPDGGAVKTTTATVNQTELSPLLSGTRYNISVQAVGPEDLKSPAVYESAFTLPNPVLNLVSRPKSTTSVEVNWSEPDGVQAYYEYSVAAVSPDGKVVDLKVTSTSTEITGLEPGTGYNISIRTIAAPGTESSVEHTFNYTLPEAVTNLTLTATTTTVELSWQRQRDHKPTYSYWVQAFQDNKLVQNNSTNTETFTFSKLCPGSFYTFKVITVVEEVMSAEASKSINTRPATVSISYLSGNTTSLSVTWIGAGCHVDSYTVRLHRNGEMVESSKDLSNTTLTKLFVGLKPGVLYCAEVVSKSGSFENTSQSVCNATFPNPPGPIMVESQTEKTINFTWSLPEDMDHRMYNFSVSSSTRSIPTENSWFLLENLESGSPYTFSVVTVGVKSYESTAVMTRNYTRPYPVNLQNGRTLITTNSVTLFWDQPESKPHYTYTVQSSNNNRPETVTNTTKTISGLLSGSNYSFTVTTQTEDGTQATSVTVSYFTRPYGIRGLKANAINTTGVHLSWTEPLDYKPEYTYLVETKDCDSLKHHTLSENSTQISALTPGTECTFCVTVRAADNTEGQETCIPQYTKPETVQPSISSSGSNSSVRVQWAKPAGRVELYKVHLNSTAGADKGEELNSNRTSFLFDGLSAGTIYSAVVTTVSGPFSETSVLVANATFPNPPGQIEVLKKTTSSIHIKWDEAPLMTGASFFYQLSNISAQRGNYISVYSTDHTFTTLQSGTPYNISVATVGAMGFQSEAVQISMVNTRPFSVKSLRVSETGEENITVKWDQPDQYKESYRFNLTLQSSDEPLSTTAKGTTFRFDSLTPGRHYNISVTTETADGTQGDPEQTSTCTKASPVTNFICRGPNKKNAELILTWDCPRGLYSGFQVSVNDGNPVNPTNRHCNHTVTNLTHYTQYKLAVKTQSCGLPSSSTHLLCRTGITDPPVPEDNKLLFHVPEKLHNKFSLQINSSLLNSSNGPITHVGVLVTDESFDTSIFRTYLGETYDDWKAGRTTVYLATVKEMNPTSRSGDSQVSIEVGDGSVWSGYTNGVLEANKNYKVAVVIFTNLELQNNLVNGEQSLASFSLYPGNVALPVDPAVVGLAVGATLGIFCILFIILIGFIVYWRRLSKKESPDIQITPMRSKSVAVRVEDFEAHYKKQKADSNCGFAEEFEDLKVVGTGQSKTNALTLENKPKNRYNNVLPYDSSRVKLSIIHGSPHDDYINANYMPGYNSRKEFIAAQGPLPHTVKEFWRMIWEKNVQTLVMLTRCNEQGRVKCEQYWAPGTKHFENIIVTTTSEIPLKDWTIRDFNVKNVKTAETRSVRHFHFTAWPDHGVPETTELLISFRHLVREHMDQYSRNSPTVVHCSAGVGRTGTFIAIDHLINQIERENTVDVYGIVYDLRMHRPLMVQTEDQYVFLNQCAIDIIRSRTGNNVDLIYQNTAALTIYENVEPMKSYSRNGY